MTKLYILEKIEESKLLSLTDDNFSNFISFDYNSHKILSDKNISHKLIDDFLNDYDRKKIEDYLAKSTDLTDLENRIKELDKKGNYNRLYI